jgi:hypothetical protein
MPNGRPQSSHRDVVIGTTLRPAEPRDRQIGIGAGSVLVPDLIEPGTLLLPHENRRCGAVVAGSNDPRGPKVSVY